MCADKITFTFCGLCLTDEPHTSACLNCLTKDLCIRKQKSSTVEFDLMTTGSL